MSGAVNAFNKMSREKATEKKNAPSSRKVREVRIRPVKGGHIVATDHEPDGDEMYSPSHEQVFTDHQAMMDHVAKHTK